MPTLIWSKVKDGLDPSVKRKAYAFLEKLQESDELPGLHIEPIVGSVDPRVRTGRVDDNYRCVMFKITAGAEPFYVIHGVWPHDKANAIAAKVRLSMNPINGVPEIARVVDDVRTQARSGQAPPYGVAAPSYAAAPEPTTHATAAPPREATEAAAAAQEEALRDDTAARVTMAPRGAPATPPTWPSGITAERLHQDLGIDLGLAAACVAAPSEHALCEIIERAPVEWQGDALLELATGTSLGEVRHVFHLDAPMPTGGAAHDEDSRLIESLKHPAAQASLHWIEDDAELRRIIESGDLGAWRLFLHPEQRAYVEGRRPGTFRLAGGAGTGKTVVAIHRAAHLARANSGARILLTTFTRNLADDLAAGLAVLDETIPKPTRLDEPGVVVKGIDQVAWAIVQHAGDRVAGAVAAVLGVARHGVLKATPEGLWQEALDDAGAALPRSLATRAFVEGEYIQVVLPERITTLAAYLRVRRSGRGVALDRAKRAAVWEVIEAYRARARELETTDYYEKAAIAAAWLAEQEAKPFDHVIVDEAQDLAPSRLQLLRALVPEGPDDLFLCEDSHQRIYGQKVVLSRCGINVRGARSRRLTLNYRTTAQNLGWAMDVLDGVDWTDLEGEAEEHRYHSARSGPAPHIVQAATLRDELDAARSVIESWLPDSALSAADNASAHRAASPEAIAVLVRDKHRRESVVSGLAERGIEVRSVDREAVRPGKPVVMTMHRAKGLEFTHVLLFGIAEGAIPRSLRDYEVSDLDFADAMLRERALLYVAATRARDVLAVSWSGKRSPLLATMA